MKLDWMQCIHKKLSISLLISWSDFRTVIYHVLNIKAKIQAPVHLNDPAIFPEVLQGLFRNILKFTI